MHKGYKQYRPSPPLADYIECYWTMESRLQTRERLIPGGRVELLINFADPVQWLVGDGATVSDTPWLMGQRNQIFHAQPTGRTDILGVRFKPGGIGAFTRIPASSLLNNMVPAELVFGKHLIDWNPILLTSTCNQARICLLENLLIQSLRQPPAEWQRLQAAIQSIRTQPDQPSIRQLSASVNWNYRRLERNFHHSVGYTPKHFHRIIRFNRAIRLIHTQPQTSLTSIGYECGYFDQSHFIKDFQQFAGTAPKSFLKDINPMAAILIENQPA